MSLLKTTNFSMGYLKCGDIITVKMKVGMHANIRNLEIDHYGIYVGDGQVVHNRPGWGWMMSGAAGGVVLSSIDEFDALSSKQDQHWLKVDDICQKDVLKCNEEVICCFSDEEITERALHRVGEKKYHLKNNNGEHFVMECSFGIRKSNQMAKALLMHYLEMLNHM